MEWEVGCTFIVRSEKRKVRARAGLSLIELVVVLIIVAIVLIGFGASATVNVKRANRSDVENELNVMASNLSDAYYDLGNPSFNPAVDEDKAKFDKFLKILESEYLGVTFKRTTPSDPTSTIAFEPTTNGFKVEIAEPLDVYEQTYKCWFVTAPNLRRYAMICSGGDNTEVEQAGYASGDYSDDIVLVIYPKTGE